MEKSVNEQLMQLAVVPHDGRYGYWSLSDLQTVFEQTGTIDSVHRVIALAKRNDVNLLEALKSFKTIQ
jgi:hypothetical protein